MESSAREFQKLGIGLLLLSEVNCLHCVGNLPPDGTQKNRKGTAYLSCMGSECSYIYSSSSTSS